MSRKPKPQRRTGRHFALYVPHAFFARLQSFAAAEERTMTGAILHLCRVGLDQRDRMTAGLAGQDLTPRPWAADPVKELARLAETPTPSRPDLIPVDPPFGAAPPATAEGESGTKSKI